MRPKNSSRTLLTPVLTAFLAVFTTLGLVSPASAQAPGMTPAPQSGPPGTIGPDGRPVPAPTPRPAGPPWTPPPGSPAYPPYAVAPEGGYVAPLSQTAQPSYLPQSVALSGPKMLRDPEDGTIPYGYHRSTRPRTGAIISGAILFGVPYLYSALIASASSDLSDNGNNRAAALFIPVLGPFIELKETSDSATASYLLVLDGLAQTAGAVLFYYGMTKPRPVFIRNDLAMTVTPAHFGKDGTGVMMLGRF